MLQIENMDLTLQLSILVITTASKATGFLTPAESFSTQHICARRPLLGASFAPVCRTSFYLQNGKYDESARLFRNEFSRTVPPERVLKRHGAKNQKLQQRKYSVEISASPDEKNALATRFSLPHIDALEASLSLRPEEPSGVENARGIVVEGQVRGTVTRKCVRSNEEFDVVLDFSIYSIVRPVKGCGQISTDDFEKKPFKPQLSRGKSERSGKELISSVKNDYECGGDNLDPSAERQEDFYGDILLEDEAIYAVNGMLDVGELVSQLFWLELDPYPKKSSSEFFFFSISG